MTFNWLAILVAALIPMVTGFLWYNKFSFEGPWMKASGMTEEKMKSGNMAKIFGLSFLFAILLAIMVSFLVIHQWGMHGVFAMDPGFGEGTGAGYDQFMQLMEQRGDTHRSFGHGAMHGFFSGLFISLGILGSNALFERKSGKYILINVGYWSITIAIMGGIICGWQ